MHSPVHKETHNGFDIKIHYDFDPQNPREWDNLGTIICSHPRHNLGDDHSFTEARDFLIELGDLSYDTNYSTAELLQWVEKIAIILPVFLYDHSGLALNTTGFSCPWDSGQVGFIYATHEAIRKEYSVSRVSAKLRDRVANQLRCELATYNDYINGNVYGYTVEKDGEEVDSCWRFVGDYEDYCLEEARSVAVEVDSG